MIAIAAGAMVFLFQAGRASSPDPATELAAASASRTAPSAAAARNVSGAGEAGASDAVDAPVHALRASLGRLVHQPRWRRGRWSVLVVSLDRGDTLFSYDPDQPQEPASNLKLFTSAAAFYYLGSGFHYQTYVLSDAPIRGGTLEGDLVLYGTGDPTISNRLFPTKTYVWESLADSLLAKGIHEIRGDVVGDASYFQGTPYGVGWKMDYVNTWYAAPVSALTFGEAMVTLRISPGSGVGWRPQIQILPAADQIALVNEATTSASGATRIHATRAAYDGPIVVTGRIRRHHRDVWRAVPVADPARYAAASFRQVLIDRGIQVDGGVRSIHDAARSPVTSHHVFAPTLTHRAPLQVLAVHHSPPLLDILTVLNKRSHNLYAEQIMRTLGRVVSGTGTVPAGRAAVHAMLAREAGTPQTTLRMMDGSGLSTLDRVDARTVVHLLAFLHRMPFYEDFVSTLPEAGGLGLHRMRRSPAEGNLVAKTGTLNNVSALSGYVTASDGEHLAFSIISNKLSSTWRAKRIEDAIGDRLARFRRPLPPRSPTLLASRPAPLTPPSEALLSPGGPPAASAGAATARAPAGDTVAPALASSQTGSTPATAAAAPPPAAPAPAVPVTHRIRRGETLSGIAVRYGLTLNRLEQANPHLRPDRIRAGDEITVPQPAAAEGSDAAQVRTSTYTIRPGDTLTDIARQHGVSVAELKRANPRLRPRQMVPGHTLLIPGSAR